jgi:hypothetical protein
MMRTHPYHPGARLLCQWLVAIPQPRSMSPSHLVCLAITSASFLLGGCKTTGDDLGPYVEPLSLYDSLDVAPQDTVIVLERGPCFGTCPVYELAIYGDGALLYNGISDVEQEGIVRSTLPRDSVRALVAAFERADYFSLPKPLPCPRIWTDDSSARTAIRLGEQAKRVHHYHGCDGWEGKERLIHLEDEIDRIVGTEQWVGR